METFTAVGLYSSDEGLQIIDQLASMKEGRCNYNFYTPKRSKGQLEDINLRRAVKHQHSLSTVWEKLNQYRAKHLLIVHSINFNILYR